MPEYFYTSTDESGKRKTECIQAVSAKEALQLLKKDENRAIVLHTDDIMAATLELQPRVTWTKGPMTPADLVSLRNISSAGLFLLTLKKLYQRLFWIFLVGSLFLFLVTRESDRLLNALIAITGPLILLPPVVALLSTAFSPIRRLNIVLEDLCWGRWNEVLRRLPPFRKMLPPLQIAVRKAAALAGLGKLDEALEVMEPFSNSSKIPHWLYLTRLAELYEFANQLELALECRAQAYEGDPGNSALQLEYANTLLKLDHDPERAQVLIAELEQQQLSDTLETVFPLAKGLLELNQGNYQPAIKQWEEAENRLKPLIKNQPFSRLYMDVACAYKAIALAELGETQTAEALYESVLPRLQALDVQWMMKRYEAVAQQ